MTCSTCTCHEILEFVVFLAKFMLFQIDYHRRHVGKFKFKFKFNLFFYALSNKYIQKGEIYKAGS